MGIMHNNYSVEGNYPLKKKNLKERAFFFNMSHLKGTLKQQEGSKKMVNYNKQLGKR